MCQNVPLCPVNYFELKAFTIKQTQEKFSTSSLTAEKNLERGYVSGREILPEITFYM